MMEQRYSPTSALLTNKRKLDGRNEAAVVPDLMNVCDHPSVVPDARGITGFGNQETQVGWIYTSCQLSPLCSNKVPLDLTAAWSW